MNFLGLSTARRLIASHRSEDYAGASCAEIFRRTSQMSHDRRWREPCSSTDRDSGGRWLWRLVRHGWNLDVRIQQSEIDGEIAGTERLKNADPQTPTRPRYTTRI